MVMDQTKCEERLRFFYLPQRKAELLRRLRSLFEKHVLVAESKEALPAGEAQDFLIGTQYR